MPQEKLFARLPLRRPTGKAARLSIPMFQERVSAGFPSPAADYEEARLDLNELCIQRPAATYFVRATGESMRGAGIFPDDVLVVDRSVKASDGDVVIAAVDGDFTVKVLRIGPPVSLEPMNPYYAPIQFDEDAELQIFGVVTYVIHDVRGIGRRA